MVQRLKKLPLLLLLAVATMAVTFVATSPVQAATSGTIAPGVTWAGDCVYLRVHVDPEGATDDSWIVISTQGVEFRRNSAFIIESWRRIENDDTPFVDGKIPIAGTVYETEDREVVLSTFSGYIVPEGGCDVSTEPTATSTAPVPSVEPTVAPTTAPTTSVPSVEPTVAPTTAPTTSVPSVKPTVAPTRPSNGSWVYTTPGIHQVNGRQWRTVCEPYSQTKRCRTEIWGTQIVIKNGRYVQQNGWTFNNMTYLPLMTRAQWARNPLGHTGQWKSTDGRQWRTECDTPATGRNGCRSYVSTQVVEYAGGKYRVVNNKEVFNNIVQFK